MAIISDVTNGMLTGAKSVESIEKKNADEAKGTTNSNDDNRNMFLQLLVTEMKYQDPMQPSDNSEYVKQMATLSQVESVQNMQTDVDEMRAASMVGKYVSITDDEGNVKEGKVDYTTKVSGDIKVSVEGELYSMTSVSGIYESDFYEAGVAADTMSSMIAEFPPLGQVSIIDEEQIMAAANLYNAMDSYQQSFLSGDVKETLQAYLNKLEEAKTRAAAIAEEQADETSRNVSIPEETDTTETAEAAGQAGAVAAAEEAAGSENETGSESENNEGNNTALG